MVTFREAYDTVKRAMSKRLSRVERLARDLAKAAAKAAGEKDLDSQDKKRIAHAVREVLGAYAAKVAYDAVGTKGKRKKKKKKK
ncbi:MAG: hypothetical protein QW680_09300 [Pyrobaculum sp.]